MHVNTDMAVTPTYYALSIGLIAVMGSHSKTITLWILHRTKIECLSRKINIVVAGVKVTRAVVVVTALVVVQLHINAHTAIFIS